MTVSSRRTLLAATLVAALGAAAPALAAPAIGKAAPAFSAVDAQGKTRTLSEFKGKTVVLEWTNEGCPYVQKHYKAGAMQALQKQAAADGVVWLTVVSSAPGKQGYLSADQAKGWKAGQNAGYTALLLDPKGDVGRAYDAKTTPHMYIVNPAGQLVYMGGIDDKPSADPASLKGAKNYVSAALADLKAGRSVAQPATKPYGCSIKY
jgi:peroxiredoxin